MDSGPAGDSTLDEWLRKRGPVQEAHLLADGEEVDGFRVTGFLGRGGSGEVYRAERLDGGAAVAIKILHRSDLHSEERFEREADVLSRHPHPALPRYLGRGVHNGRPYLAMEELAPGDLPRTDRAAARFLLAVCEGVAHLHSLGLVHRDIKPANILFRADGTPVLIDLGLLKDTSDSGPLPSGALSVVDGKPVGAGTPGYSAPEQFFSGEITPAADVHALGVLAETCFEDRPPRAWRPILQKATSSLPGERHASVREFAGAIRRRHLHRALPAAILLALAATTGALVHWAMQTAPGEIRAPELGRALNAEDLRWTTGGDVPWHVSTDIAFDGVSAAASSNNGKLSRSWIRVRVKGPATVRFQYWKCFYGAVFTIDCDGNYLMADKIPAHNTPDTGWKTVELDIPKGRHKLTFTYQHGGIGWRNDVNDVVLDRFEVIPRE